MTFKEAMDIWLAGGQIHREVYLLGLTIGWWARLAKLLQLVSGLVVLIDILGVDRIRSGGKHLRGLISRELVFSTPAFIKRRLRVLQFDVELWVCPQEEPQYNLEPSPVEGAFGRPLGPGQKVPNPHYSEARNRDIRERRTKLEYERRLAAKELAISWAHYIPGLIGVGLFAMLNYNYVAWLPGSIEWLVFFVLSPLIFFLSAYLILGILAAVVRLPAVLIEWVVIEPIGRFLDHHRLKEALLALSLGLFVIASLIDILLS